MKTAKIEPSKQIDEETELGIVICGECKKVFPSISECEEHMKDHTWQCYKCNLTLESKEDLSKHEVNQHIFRKCDKTHIDPCKILPVKEFNCNDGDLNLNSQKEKDIHKYEHTKISDVKQASTMINCDQCDYTSPDVKAFVSHILSTHAETGGTCGRCGYRSVTRERLQNHMVEEHADLELMSIIMYQLEQVSNIFNVFDGFKTDLTGEINKLIGGHNTMMQEISVIKQMVNSVPEKESCTVIFCCEDCEFRSSDRGQLKNHKNEHHKDKLGLNWAKLSSNWNWGLL